MAETQNIPWKRLSVEAAAIVISILLAFAIDAWWEGQKDREIEQELLVSLVQEFERAATEFDIQGQRHDRRLAGATQLANLTEQSVQQLDSETLRNLWFQAYSPAISDPPEGALTSAIATGSISLSRNKVLKSRLTDWSGQLADLHHTEQNLSYYMNNILIPDISQRALLPHANAVSGPDFGDALLAMPTKNHLNWIAHVTGISMKENEQAQYEVAEILELLRNEIAP